MKEPKVKKVKSPEQERKDFCIATLRRASYRWSSRTQALGRARISRGLYVCESCKIQTKKSDIQLDHILSVIPLEGWQSWDSFIERLFCDASGYSVLCKTCHSAKTMQENHIRRENKKKKLDNPV